MIPQSVYISFFIGFSVLIPLSLGLWRVQKIDPKYYPLLIILACALVSETFADYFVWQYYQYDDKNYLAGRSYTYNIYVIVISCLYLRLFFNWGTLGTKPQLFYSIISIFLLIWSLEHFTSTDGKLNLSSSTNIFRLLYSTSLCLLAIRQLNLLIIHERKSLLKNSIFFICCGVLFFFITYIIQESVRLFNPKASLKFFEYFSYIKRYSVLIMYFLYSLAILWMPPKKPFIQLS